MILVAFCEKILDNDKLVRTPRESNSNEGNNTNLKKKWIFGMGHIYVINKMGPKGLCLWAKKFCIPIYMDRGSG